MDAREIESLSMISRGFEELGAVNPELAYNLVLDMLTGINEYVSTPSQSSQIIDKSSLSSEALLCAVTYRPPAASSLTSGSSAGAR